jgi:hypothetical protein
MKSRASLGGGSFVRYMLGGIAFSAVRSPTVPSLEHGLSSLATPGTEACDAARGAFRPQGREWPAKNYLANLVRAGAIANAAVYNICITSESVRTTTMDAQPWPSSKRDFEESI